MWGQTRPSLAFFGDELRAIKRDLAIRQDNLPWLFLSERQTQLKGQAVNYIVRLLGMLVLEMEVKPSTAETSLPLIGPKEV